MAINQQRTTGRASNYKFDRGGTPTDFGPFTGEIMNNIDDTRSGRVQVYIKQFAGTDKQDKSKWRTVSYVSPFAGASPKTSTSAGVGTYGSTNNQQSYGMAASPPDIGVEVLCFFIGGDPNQGVYIGCIQAQGMNSMTPAIGATSNAAKQNTNQDTYFAKSPQLPATEINNAEQNTAIVENPQFFNQAKPVHSYVAATLFQAGTVNDTIRGPITSSSQRESPSNAYGLSTPGRPIYQGGLNDATIKQQVAGGSVKPEDVNVVGRKGGHSLVLDDGDASGTNSLIRIRTAKGHQITMSDDGNCFYIAHANGQVWLEFGQEGTLDVYTTNSINLRTEGTMNLHADKDFNVWAGGNINMKSQVSTTMESEGTFTCANKDVLTLFSETTIGVKSNGQLAIDGMNTSMLSSGGGLIIQGPTVDINPGSAPTVAVPAGLVEYTMPDGQFDTSSGWNVDAAGLQSIVTRAPGHEPWPYHNQGVQASVSLSNGTNSSPPGAPTVPSGVSITKTS
jgi:hypothetical protein